MEPFIKINGVPFPYPKRGLELITSTFVDSARNTNGQVVGQKVGRDQYKVNRCEWPVLTADQWARMLRMFNDFFVVVTFPDQVSNSWRNLIMYPGDRTAEPYKLDEKTGLPVLLRNCRVNLIDAGYSEGVSAASYSENANALSDMRMALAECGEAVDENEPIENYAAHIRNLKNRLK